MIGRKAYMLLGVLLLMGCGPSEQAVETKAADVHPSIPQAQQDQIAASFKTWKPDKKK